MVIASVVYSNTADGLGLTNQTSTNVAFPRNIYIVNSVFYGNGSDGIALTAQASNTPLSMAVYNSIIYNNTSNGITLSQAGVISFARNNAFGANGTARTNWPVGVGDVTLTADPFVNAAGANFALNSTAGGGVSCKAAGFPGVLITGGTGFMDIGPVQAQFGSSSGQKSCGFVQ